MTEFHGAWPALLTPFHADDTINVPMLRKLIDYHLDKEVDGFYICGSTGEGVFTPKEQRKVVAEATVEQVNGRVPVIAHIGCMASGDAVDLAQHAQQVGVDGISSIIPPQYTTIDSLYTYFAALGKAAPDLPLLPYILGTSIDVVTLMRALMEIPNVAGTKYTGPNMYEFRQILELSRVEREHGWSIFSGMDEQCVFAAMFGSCGNIGSTLNYIPRPYKAIHASLKAGDFAQARDIQLKANRTTEVMIAAGFPGAMRAVMDRLGFALGAPRLPNQAMGIEQQEALFAQLDAVGFAELV